MDFPVFKKNDIVYIPPIPEIDFSGHFLIKGVNKDFYRLESLDEGQKKVCELDREFDFVLQKVTVYVLSDAEFSDILSFKTGWDQAFGNSEPETVIIKGPKKVTLTLDSLLTLLLEASHQSERKEDSYLPCANLSDLFLYFRLHYTSLFTNSPIITPSYTLASFIEDAALTKFFAKSDNICDVNTSTFLPEDIKSLIDYAKYLKEIVGKPLIDRPLNDEDAANLIVYYDNVGHHEYLVDNEEAKKTFLFFLKKLEAKDNPAALAILGDDYYVGTILFPQDYKKTVPYFLKLSAINNYLADMRLGNIYLNGLDGNPPDYNKAFKYFSIGELGGFSACFFKLADMMEEGLGVPKDPKLANDLVTSQYRFELKSLLSGNLCTFFPDLAYRLGHYAYKGIGEEVSEVTAAYDLLLAQETLKLRDLAMDFPFENDLKKKIDAELLAVLPTLPEKTRSKIYNDSAIDIFSQAFAQGCSVNVTIKRKKKDSIGLTLSYYRNRGVPSPRFLVSDTTGAEARFIDECSFLLTLPPWASSDMVEEGVFHIDKIEETNSLKGYYHGKTLFFIPFDQSRIEPFKEKKSEKMISLVSLSSRDNDYGTFLAPKGQIKVGDIVDATFNGLPKSATVVKIFSISEDDSPLHEEDYMTISTRGA